MCRFDEMMREEPEYYPLVSCSYLSILSHASNQQIIGIYECHQRKKNEGKKERQKDRNKERKKERKGERKKERL